MPETRNRQVVESMLAALGALIHRVRDGRVAEGWGIGRGADSTAPW